VFDARLSLEDGEWLAPLAIIRGAIDCSNSAGKAAAASGKECVIVATTSPTEWPSSQVTNALRRA
jgi:hypothetical protein